MDASYCCVVVWSGINVFYGDNAQGKTSLLEAIYLLAAGRSFRTGQLKHLIQTGQDALLVYAVVAGGHGQNLRLGVQFSAAGFERRLDGDKVRSAADLAQHLPVQVITPESHRLLEQGARVRRQLGVQNRVILCPGVQYRQAAEGG